MNIENTITDIKSLDCIDESLKVKIIEKNCYLIKFFNKVNTEMMLAACDSFKIY